MPLEAVGPTPVAAGSRAVSTVPVVILSADRGGTIEEAIGPVENIGTADPPVAFPNHVPSGTATQSTVIVPLVVTGFPVTLNLPASPY